MPTTPRKPSVPQSMRALEPASRRKRVPFAFVLDALAEKQPTTRAMFGALAVYAGEKIVFLLRDRPTDPQANGVWIAIRTEYQESLRDEFPNAGPVRILGKEISGWRLLAGGADDFEASALHACELVIRNDPRIGKVPNKSRTAT